MLLALHFVMGVGEIRELTVMEYIAIWPEILYVLLGGAVWGLVALLCARTFSHGENRTAIEQVGLRPMLTGGALAICVSLPGFVFILLTSPAGVYLLAVVHAAAVAYLVTLDSQRSAQILSFPLSAPLYAIAGVIGKTDSLGRYVSKIASSSAEPGYMKWPKQDNVQDNVIIAASIVVWIGLLITLFVLVNR